MTHAAKKNIQTLCHTKAYTQKETLNNTRFAYAAVLVIRTTKEPTRRQGIYMERTS